ncbi:MAG: hypothetical protein BMS9Abin07_0816 [Acidimicrobiia bacterium]|nr:MAG: hypothetical protein BMS9Abin07_0816 [Acidimicrobiia bacterium]
MRRRLKKLTGTVLVILLVSSAAQAAAPFDDPLDADDLQARAQTIVSGRAYTGERDSFLTDNPVTRFIDAVLQRIRDWLSPGDEVRTGTPETQVDPGRPSYGWLLLVVLLLLAITIAVVIARRRLSAEFDQQRITDVERRGDAEELEDLADAAEAAGRFEDALRLRFRAGLIRLDDLDVIAYDPTLATGAVRSALHMGEFDTVASQFERVAYSDYDPQRNDVTSHEQGWLTVLGRLEDEDHADG